MSVYYEKARELGELIRESEQSKRLADARAAFEADTEAAEKMAEFRKLEKTAPDCGAPTPESVAALKEPVIDELIAAEDEYYALLDRVIDVLRMTVLGSAAEEDEGCGRGRCAGCGKGNGKANQL